MQNRDAICYRVATLWGLGLLGRAPGTSGAAAGVLLYGACFRPFAHNAFYYGALLILLLAVSVWVCDRAERFIGRKDASEIILDECAVMPLVYAWLPLSRSVWAQVVLVGVGFVFFRLFDIWKPLFIHPLQRIPGGLGIVIDDVAAALCAAGMVTLSAYLG